MSVVSFEQAWIARANAALAGRRILDVIYANRDDTRALGWSLRPPVIVLSGDLQLWPSADAEGNDAGALMTTDPAAATLPPLRLEEFIPRPPVRR
jgi:hypothetical protein